ncbi:putative bifunctional diguanylate cyclase/phosphodiesterase [Crenobacter cavernae]|uniref:Bifunctional diguanylate cyclase/phosphodiesterase n=1 Tax=Crenobacter cavernae TaxID=2290923 RepID=A0A345Y2L4_9NEIS|nr:EAL domain-containing protein [Crenobacter cavernae]AXK38166.1 bifunctional diguanylate cyclase/phosphodiesterase [Crenobacter cavernae]
MVAEIDPALLRRRWEREHKARLEAEAIAERGLRELYYQRQQDIQLLEAIAAVTNAAGSVEETMYLAVQLVCQYTQWPVGHVYYTVPPATDSACNLISSQVWHCADAERFAGFRAATSACSIAPGQGLPGRILASGEPAWISDITQDSDFPRCEAAWQAGLKAAIGFPVWVGLHLVAILEFFADEVTAPDERMLRIMRLVGSQLGRVIERQRAKDHLTHAAFHDPLTLLPNRALFFERLQSVLNHSKQCRGYQFAVLFLDLDRFKVVNDSLGHPAGDRLIIEVAQRLSASLRRSDSVVRPIDECVALPSQGVVARLGGDEFTIILEDIQDASVPILVAERIQRALAAPFVLSGQQVFTTASIGIALSTPGYDEVQEILRDADIAMYRAKAGGRARWEVFDQRMGEQAVAHLRLDSELRDALRRREFRLCYQPIVSLLDGKIRGFEALLRWEHPSKGCVSPMEFLPTAEETGLILPIGQWVLEEACLQAQRWQQAFLTDPPLTMSVNLSASQLSQPGFIEQVKRILRKTAVVPSSLKLELTESMAMSDPEHTARLLFELKAMGIQLSLDDFGTGYSSLSYLSRLPIDTLKIDRSFVSGLEKSSENLRILEAIVTLARTLNMEVVAEGTETIEEVIYLKRLNCEYAQGYFFFKPLGVADAEAALRQQLHQDGRTRRLDSAECAAYPAFCPRLSEQ